MDIQTGRQGEQTMVAKITCWILFVAFFLGVGWMIAIYFDRQIAADDYANRIEIEYEQRRINERNNPQNNKTSN